MFLNLSRTSKKYFAGFLSMYHNLEFYEGFNYASKQDKQ